MSFQAKVQKLVKLYPILEDTAEQRAESLYAAGHRANTAGVKFNFENTFEQILRLDHQGKWILKAILDNWPGEIEPRVIKALDTIIANGTPEYIFLTGVRLFEDFNFEKAMHALFTRRQEDGWYIYLAGSQWKKFDYKKGLDALISQDRIGEAIYKAGLSWKNFDYQKGLAALKNISETKATGIKYSSPYYYDAVKNWPKGTAEVIQQSKEMKAQATKMPKKQFSAKE
jgi:hypothetical protein